MGEFLLKKFEALLSEAVGGFKPEQFYVLPQRFFEETKPDRFKALSLQASQR